MMDGIAEMRETYLYYMYLSLYGETPDVDVACSWIPAVRLASAQLSVVSFLRSTHRRNHRMNEVLRT
jgi:hypothetical protein